MILQKHWWDDYKLLITIKNIISVVFLWYFYILGCTLNSHDISDNITIFEDRKIRRIYDEKTEKWFFSVVDIVQALVQQPDYQTARKYWNKLKQRSQDEGSQLVTNCHQLKMVAKDGKLRLTDVATSETLLRLI